MEALEPRILLSATVAEAAAVQVDEGDGRSVAREVISISHEAVAQAEAADSIDIFGDVEGAIALEDVAEAEANEPTPTQSAVVVAVHPEAQDAIAPEGDSTSDSTSAKLVETLNAGQGPPASDPVVLNETIEATITWFGGTGDWGVGANWSGGVSPGSGDTAIINSGTVLGTGSRTVGGLEIGAGGMLIIQGNSTSSTGQLTVNSAWTNHGVVELTSIQGGQVAQLLGAAVTNSASGTLLLSVGAGGSRTINAAVLNAGTVTLNQPLTMNVGASMSNSDTWTLNASQTTNFSAGGQLFTHTGSFTIESTEPVTLRIHAVGAADPESAFTFDTVKVTGILKSLHTTPRLADHLADRGASPVAISKVPQDKYLPVTPGENGNAWGKDKKILPMIDPSIRAAPPIEPPPPSSVMLPQGKPKK